MTTHAIEIEGLPEGYEIKRIYTCNHKLTEQTEKIGCVVELQKSKPRRIVLEETEEETDPLLYQPIKIDGLCVLMVAHNKIWRVKEE